MPYSDPLRTLGYFMRKFPDICTPSEAVALARDVGLDVTLRELSDSELDSLATCVEHVIAQHGGFEECNGFTPGQIAVLTDGTSGMFLDDPVSAEFVFHLRDGIEAQQEQL